MEPVKSSLNSAFKLNNWASNPHPTLVNPHPALIQPSSDPHPTLINPHPALIQLSSNPHPTLINHDQPSSSPHPTCIQPSSTLIQPSSNPHPTLIQPFSSISNQIYCHHIKMCPENQRSVVTSTSLTCSPGHHITKLLL